MNQEPKTLLAALSLYGYPLMEPEMKPDPYQLLVSLVKSRDARLLEGFPVVLANILSQKDTLFKLARAESLCRSTKDRQLLRYLYRLSFQLFDLYDFEFSQLNRSNSGWLLDEQLKNKLANDRLLKFKGIQLDPRRLKRVFLDYVVNNRNFQGRSLEEKLKLKEEFRREYYLSLLLSPKQKELLNKRLDGESMTKTEREYFSRVVRKKLQALINPNLHELARQALQKN
ncbi:MAG: hypothetical protein HYT97_06785 [Elusimicrobia bacterium]|nr:hypothetical protein [Elusimicrobiota bacterium]